MAEQGVSNERRKELEQMDPFQEFLVKALAYARENKNQLIMILGAVAVVLIVFSVIMVSFKRSETRAAELVAAAASEYAKTYTKTEDPKKGYDAVFETYEKVMDEYANTSAGKLAMVSYAKICFDAGELDKAKTYYSMALERLDNQAGMENLLLSALGNLAQARGDLDEAKTYYLKIENGGSGMLKDEARFALAQIYEVQNDLAASLKMYEKILKENKNSLYRPIAEAMAGKEK